MTEDEVTLMMLQRRVLEIMGDLNHLYQMILDARKKAARGK